MKKYFSYFVIFCFVLLVSCESKSEAGLSSGSGTGGSMARFTVAGNQLYIVTNTSLKTYDIANSENPKTGQKTQLSLSGNGAETIFPYKNHLFIGTQTGMYIFNVENPEQPRQVSFYQHVVSCDPVVVQGNYAYVTLRGGTTCRNSLANSLDVVDISNLSLPKLVKSYPMTGPYGLGVDGNRLFVCEGSGGLKVFDNSNPLDLKLIEEIKDVQTYDVIPKNKTLIVTGKDGIFQYSYQDGKTLKLLSQMKVG